MLKIEDLHVSIKDREKTRGKSIQEETKEQRGGPFSKMLDQIIISSKISVTANKSGDAFDRATFVRHEKTDAEGVEIQETEVIRNGELITLLGNRNVTKATPYSNAATDSNSWPSRMRVVLARKGPLASTLIIKQRFNTPNSSRCSSRKPKSRVVSMLTFSGKPTMTTCKTSSA